MTDYEFETNLVIDPANPSNVVAGGSITLYGPSDTGGTTPLVLKTPTGLPLSNPITSNANGFTPPFIATVSQVRWSGGGFTGYWSSYQGLLDAALAAAAAAEEAADSVANGGSGLPSGGSNGQFLGRVSGSPQWVNAPSGGTVDAGDVADIIADAVNAGTGPVVGALDDRYQQTGKVALADLPAGSTVVVRKSGSSWPTRPTSRADIVVMWIGADPDPNIVSSGTGGALDNVDVRMTI